MVGSSYRKEVRHSRRPRDPRSREVKGSSSHSTARRISRTTSRTDSISVDYPPRCSRRSKYSQDTRSCNRPFSSSGSEISCCHHRKHRSRRYDYTERRSSRRREYSPASSSYHSSLTDRSNVWSVDTAVNSESRLQDIGRVVKASDLSDYSDQYTLGSREMEEFEEYLEKHKHRGHRNFYDSDTEGSSAIYSLDDSVSVNPGVGTSDDTSGIVEVDSRNHRGSGIIACGYRTIFCIDDDSIQGSYGGLREDEVLIASTPSLKTCGSGDVSDADDFTNSGGIAEVSGRSMSRRVERIESTAESVSSHASGKEDRDDCETVKTEEPSAVSRFFCAWNPGSPRSDVGSSDEEEDDDDDDGYDDLPQVVTASMTHHGNDSTASYTSSKVVWQRTSSYDSITESLSEERADSIAKKARAETILNRFKQEKQIASDPSKIQRVPLDSRRDDVEQETLSPADVDYQRPDDHEILDKTDPENLSTTESNREITGSSINNVDSQSPEISATLQPSDPDIANSMPPTEIETSTVQCDAISEYEATAIEEFDRSVYDRTYVLGDNVEVVTITEMETGNGDTGFLIHLRVSRESLTPEGEATVQRLMTTQSKASRALGTCQSADITRSWREAKNGLAVFIVTDDTDFYEDPPRLFIEENASQYLETLGRLSEASYHCLDIKTQQEVCRALQSKQFSDIPLETVSHRNENESNDLLPCPTLREGSTQFIFCMRAGDMICREFDVQLAESQATGVSTSLEESQMNPQKIEQPNQSDNNDGDNGKQNTAHNHLNIDLGKETGNSHDAKPGSNDEIAPKDTTQEAESVSPDAFDKDAGNIAKSCEGEDGSNKVRQALAAAISKNRSNPKYLRGMSRATVRAHVLLQGGKVPRHFSRSKSTRTADSTADSATGGATPGKGVITPKHACSILVGGGEDSTSSRGLSLHRSSGEESLKGTRFIHDEAKSLSGSFSNHSSGIHGYLQFLEEQDNEDDTESGCRASVTSFVSQRAKNISDKAVAETMEILGDLNFNLNYDDSYSSDGNDDTESPANAHTNDSAPIPSHIPNVNALLFGHSQDTKGEVVASTKSDLNSGERQLKSYEERWRLSQQLLLTEDTRPVNNNGSARQGMVEFKKSQIDRNGLLRKRRTSASVASSHGSNGSYDEFFDAVSQNSSSLSVE